VKVRSIAQAHFVRDEVSSVLALSDALASERGDTIIAAFLVIAQSRGIAQIAIESGLPEQALYASLVDPEKLDTQLLHLVADSMLGRIAGFTDDQESQ
jgi:DNA-binding phage protein